MLPAATVAAPARPRRRRSGATRYRAGGRPLLIEADTARRRRSTEPAADRRLGARDGPTAAAMRRCRRQAEPVGCRRAGKRRARAGRRRRVPDGAPAPSRSRQAPCRRARFEQVVGELLEPVIRQWLDSNLPRLVEKAVREEVARAMAAERDGQE